MRIVVTGSLAYDYLMTFPGKFRDHFLSDRMHRLTVSFLVDDMRRLRGGVAGNIAWTLALLGGGPLLIATAGEDFAEYRTALDRAGVDTSGVTVIPGEFTASCFINTDQDANQIVAFYAGALSHGHKLELGGRGLGPSDLVVISPTDPGSMLKAVEACRTARVPYLFDPGKQTPRLEAQQILDGMESASAVIGNDYEFALMSQKTGKSEAVLQSIAPVTIVTRGEQGSTVLERGKPPVDVPVAPNQGAGRSDRGRGRVPRRAGVRDGAEAALARGGAHRRGGGGVRDRGAGMPGAQVHAPRVRRAVSGGVRERRRGRRGAGLNGRRPRQYAQALNRTSPGTTSTIRRRLLNRSLP